MRISVSLTLRAVWDSLRETTEATAGILFIVSTAAVFAWVLTLDRVPAVADDFVEVLRQEVAKQGTADVLTVGPRIARGEEVELAHGPLGGVRATVVEVLPARERVKVLLEFLGREQIIEVDLFSLLLPRKPLP